MPIKYIEIRDKLRTKIGLADSLMSKVARYVLLGCFIWTFFRIGNSRGSVGLLIWLIILGVSYRLNVLYERINIKNLAIDFKQGAYLDIDRTKTLISDIEQSLKKINSFAKWSCGILATIVILAITILFDFFKDVLEKEEILKLVLVSDEEIDVQKVLLQFLGQGMLFVIISLMVYYFLVQVVAYNKRFVCIVLKSSLYIDDKEQKLVKWSDKINYSINNFFSGF